MANVQGSVELSDYTHCLCELLTLSGSSIRSLLSVARESAQTLGKGALYVCEPGGKIVKSGNEKLKNAILGGHTSLSSLQKNYRELEQTVLNTEEYKLFAKEAKEYNLHYSIRPLQLTDENNDIKTMLHMMYPRSESDRMMMTLSAMNLIENERKKEAVEIDSDGDHVSDQLDYNALDNRITSAKDAGELEKQLQKKVDEARKTYEISKDPNDRPPFQLLAQLAKVKEKLAKLNITHRTRRKVRDRDAR